MKLLVPRRKLLLGAAAGICAPAIVRAQQLSTTLAGPGTPPASAGFAWTATGNPAGQNTSSTSATFSGVFIGSPASADVIVAVVSAETTAATGVTCNSVGMTKQVEESTVLSGLQIWSITAGSASVAGSATTTFVVSSSGTMNNEVIQVGKISGTIHPTPTNFNSQTSATAISVTVPSGGVAIVGAYQFSQVALTWIGGTQDFFTIIGTSALSTVHAPATGSVSETPQTSGNIHFVYASWGP